MPCPSIEADRLGVHPGHGLGHGHHVGLPVDARGREADPVVAVVVDRRAQDHGVDVVAVGQGVGQALQHHDPRALAVHRALGRGVEGAAVAVGGEDAVGLVEVARGRGTETRTPPARARSHSPLSRLWTARCTATSDVEQAVCTVRLGPRSPSL